MTEIRQAGIEQRELLLKFLQKAPISNTFFIADIERYGFDKAFQQVWMQRSDGKLTTVYLRFYQNLLVYSDCAAIDPFFIDHITKKYDIMTIMGRNGDLDGLALRCAVDWRVTKKQLMSLCSSQKLPRTELRLRSAGPEDSENIYRFLQQIEGFDSLYASKSMIFDRLKNRDGIHLLLESNGDIISHGNSTVSTSYSVFLGGISTRPDMRGRGYASAVVSALSRSALDKGVFPCVFCNSLTEHNLFVRLGFIHEDDWMTVERSDE